MPWLLDAAVCVMLDLFVSFTNLLQESSFLSKYCAGSSHMFIVRYTLTKIITDYIAVHILQVPPKENFKCWRRPGRLYCGK